MLSHTYFSAKRCAAHDPAVAARCLATSSSGLRIQHCRHGRSAPLPASRFPDLFRRRAPARFSAGMLAKAGRRLIRENTDGIRAAGTPRMAANPAPSLSPAGACPESNMTLTVERVVRDRTHVDSPNQISAHRVCRAVSEALAHSKVVTEVEAGKLSVDLHFTHIDSNEILAGLM